MVGARNGKPKHRNEPPGFRIIFRPQLAAVRFNDRADSIQTKTIMALADVPEGFAPPILRHRIKLRFWFMEREQEAVTTDFGSCQQRTVATMVPESIGKKLHKHFL